MPITEVDYGNGLPVDSYGPGFFRIGGEVHRGNVLVQSDTVTTWGGLDDLDPLIALGGQIDVLFVGTGAEIAYLPKPLLRALEPLGVMCEPMSTPSAARTYNVLLTEGRRVAAALVAMP